MTLLPEQWYIKASILTECIHTHLTKEKNYTSEEQVPLHTIAFWRNQNDQ